MAELQTIQPATKPNLVFAIYRLRPEDYAKLKPEIAGQIKPNTRVLYSYDAKSITAGTGSKIVIEGIVKNTNTTPQGKTYGVIPLSKITHADITKLITTRNKWTN